MVVLPHAAGAYLLGCVPAARLVARWGAAFPWGRYAPPLADAAKGYLAVALFAPTLSLGPALPATAVVVGHQWPALWGVGGGASEPGREDGIAVLVGALAAITPISLPLWAALWALGFVLTGFLRASAVVATALVLPAVGLVAGWPLALLALPATVMVLERQKKPILRWLRGEEPKFLWRDDG